MKEFCSGRGLSYVESSMYDVPNVRRIVLPVVREVYSRKSPDRCDGVTLDEVAPSSKKCCLN